jgi:hypothetical protein
VEKVSNECKKIIFLSNFFAGGGEIMERKTGIKIIKAPVEEAGN